MNNLAIVLFLKRYENQNFICLFGKYLPIASGGKYYELPNCESGVNDAIRV
jgi:hypothetical protein